MLAMGGRTYREVATTLGLPPETVARRLREALAVLRPVAPT